MSTLPQPTALDMNKMEIEYLRRRVNTLEQFAREVRDMSVITVEQRLLQQRAMDLVGPLTQA